MLKLFDGLWKLFVSLVIAPIAIVMLLRLKRAGRPA